MTKKKQTKAEREKMIKSVKGMEHYEPPTPPYTAVPMEEKNEEICDICGEIHHHYYINKKSQNDNVE
jgi:hypothetical protein